MRAKKHVSIDTHRIHMHTPVAYSVAHPGMVGQIRGIHHRVCSAAAAPGAAMGTLSLVHSDVHSMYIRVHSEYSRFCSTAAADENGQTQLVHSEVHSRYIREHSGTFGDIRGTFEFAAQGARLTTI